MPRQSRSSYSQYVRFGLLMMKLLRYYSPESLNDTDINQKDMLLPHLSSRVFNASQSSFVFLHIEVTSFYIRIIKESTVFHAPRLYLFEELLLPNADDQHKEHNKSLKESFSRFVIGNFATSLRREG